MLAEKEHGKVHNHSRQPADCDEESGLRIKTSFRVDAPKGEEGKGENQEHGQGLQGLLAVGLDDTNPALPIIRNIP